MKISSVGFLFAILMIATMAGCVKEEAGLNGGESPGQKEQVTAAQESGGKTQVSQELKKIDTVTFVTGTSGGTWAAIGQGIAEKTNEYFEGYPISALPGPGSVGNPAVVGGGEAQIGMSYGSFLLSAQEGEEPFEEAFPNLKAIAATTPTVVHITAAVSLEDESLSQLMKGDSSFVFGCQQAGQGSYMIASQMLEACDLTMDTAAENGIKMYFSDGSGLTDAWQNGQIDLSVNTYNVVASAVEEALVGREGTLLSLGEPITSYLKKFGFVDYTIPAGTYSGQDKDVQTVAQPLVIFCSDSTPDDVAYYMAKAIYENKDYMTNVNSSFKEFEPDKAADGVGVELHPGAAKYYREIGLIQ